MIKLRESDLLLCCGSKAWAKKMSTHTFPNPKEVFATCDSIWWSLAPADWREALATHQRYGEKGHHNIPHASEATLAALHDLNQKYEDRFGYVFVVFVNGRSAHSVLEDLKGRIGNDPAIEIKVAAMQQLDITHARLKRLLGL